MLVRPMKEPEMQTVFSQRDILRCPRCEGLVTYTQERFACVSCGKTFPIVDGIPQFFWPAEGECLKTDVTEQIKAFYEKTPFPNYDEFDSIGSLVDKARRRVFAKLLDDQIPYGARIIECGCGTGQLTNFLSVAGRTVIGADICLNSLRMAEDFKTRNALKRAHFFQMNLFRPCFAPGSFDLVISNGVLHHTSDPLLAFRTISRLVKPKGYILVGLYHRYGRLSTDLRRLIFRAAGNRFLNLDPRMSEQISKARKNAWFTDQYKNPHESKHTIGEVLTWLKETGFSFVKSIPKTIPFEQFHESEKLFIPDRLGSWLTRTIVEVSMAFTASGDGGLFIVIAQKRA